MEPLWQFFWVHLTLNWFWRRHILNAVLKKQKSKGKIFLFFLVATSRRFSVLWDVVNAEVVGTCGWRRRRTQTKPCLFPSLPQVMQLCRPPDSRLEHVDFECLFSCLSPRLLLRVFGSLLLERRVIFTADKLRSAQAHGLMEVSDVGWKHVWVVQIHILK